MAEPKHVRNCTPKRLILCGRDAARLVLAPLERREVDEEICDQFDFNLLQRRGMATCEEPTDSDAAVEKVVQFVFTAAIATFIFSKVVLDSLTHAEEGPDKPAGPLSQVEWVAEWSWSLSAASAAGVIAVGALIAWWRISAGAAQRSLMQIFSLLLMLGIAVGVPALVVFYYGGLDVRAVGKPESAGRILQFALICAATLLPALLYFLSDRQTLAAVHERFMRDVFRLDPYVETISDVEAKYGAQLEDIRSSGNKIASRSRHLYGNRWPVPLATFGIVFGWIIVLTPFDSTPSLGELGPDASLPSPSGATPPGTQPGAADSAELPGAQSTDARVLTMLVPQNRPYVYGFLGAYLFTMSMLLRRYFRGDLRPKAYTHTAARILAAVIAGWVIELLFGVGPWAAGAAFTIGVFPENLWTLIRGPISSRIFESITREDARQRHLSELEGADAYDWARLMDEGITNLEALAHHDLVSLMIETRIPAARLVDWVDQAILRLHADPFPRQGQDEPDDTSKVDRSAEGGNRRTEGASGEEMDTGEARLTRRANLDDKTARGGADSLYRRLRLFGIRTASDLEYAYFWAQRRGRDYLTAWFNEFEGESSAQPKRLQTVIDALCDDEWFDYIRQWRRSTGQITEVTCVVPAGSRAVGADSTDITVDATLPATIVNTRVVSDTPHSNGEPESRTSAKP